MVILQSGYIYFRVDKVEIPDSILFRAMGEQPYYFVGGLTFLMGERMLLVRVVRGLVAGQTLMVEL